MAVPGVTGLGYASKAVGKAVGETLGSTTRGIAGRVWKALGGKTDDAIRAAKTIFGDGRLAMGYNALKGVVDGLGYQVHHLIEKRFADIVGLKPGDILSIAISDNFHTQITNRMRKLIGYVGGCNPINTVNATNQHVWDAVVQVYTDLGLTEYLPALKEQLLTVEKNSNIDWGNW